MNEKTNYHTANRAKRDERRAEKFEKTPCQPSFLGRRSLLENIITMTVAAMMVNEEVFTATWYSYRLNGGIAAVAVGAAAVVVVVVAAASIATTIEGYTFSSFFALHFLLIEELGFIFLCFMLRAYPFFPLILSFEFSVVIYVLGLFIFLGPYISSSGFRVLVSLCACTTTVYVVVQTEHTQWMVREECYHLTYCRTPTAEYVWRKIIQNQ